MLNALAVTAILALGQSDNQQQYRSDQYRYDDQSSGLFGACGRRKEDIEKNGSDTPYEPNEFRTIKQWGNIAAKSPRPPSNGLIGGQFDQAVIRYEQAQKRQRGAADTLADMAIAHSKKPFLGRTEIEECRAECLRLLKSPNSDVRAHAVRGLGAIGDRDCFVEINKLSEDRNQVVRRLAKEAIASISQR